MNINIQIMIRMLQVSLCVLLITSNPMYASNKELREQYKESVTIAPKILKTIYEPNEPFPLIIGIANHNKKPIYLSIEEPNEFAPSISIKDANSLDIMGDPFPDPPPEAPGDYYMVKDGKRVFVTPIYKIDGPGICLLQVPDALKRFHKHLSEGTYYLDPIIVEVIHDVNEIIERKDVPHKLWIIASSPRTRIRHTLYPVLFEIRKKPESSKEPAIQKVTNIQTP
jgi:hypothetical protein